MVSCPRWAGCALNKKGLSYFQVEILSMGGLWAKMTSVIDKYNYIYVPQLMTEVLNPLHNQYNIYNIYNIIPNLPLHMYKNRYNRFTKMGTPYTCCFVNCLVHLK